MSNIEHAIIPGDSSFSTILFKPFADNQGVIFALFSYQETAENDTGIKAARERLERWAARPTPESSLLEVAFEHIIQTINENRIGLKKNNYSQHLQGVIGTTNGSLLVMTSIGGFRGTLVRREKQGTYHVYELLNGLEQITEDNSFSALVSGELKPDDTLGLALAKTISKIDETFWKKTLATCSPHEIETSLKSHLDPNLQTGAILIVHTTAEPTIAVHSTASTVTSPANSKDSIRALRKTEHLTENVLNNRGFGFLTLSSKFGHWLWRQIIKAVPGLVWLIKYIYSHLVHRQTSNIEPEPAVSTSTIDTSPATFPTLPKPKNQFIATWQAVTGIILSIIGFFGLILHLFQHPIHFCRNYKQSLADFSAGLNRIHDFLIQRFNVLPRMSKLLLISALILLALFTQSLVYLHYRQASQVANQDFNMAVTTIEEIRNQAEGMIIYHNEATARELLKGALTQIEKLPQNSRSRRQMVSDLNNQINSDLKKLLHEILVTDTMITTPEKPPEASAFDYWLTKYDDPASTNPVTTIINSKTQTLAVHRDNSVTLNSNDTVAPLPLPANQGLIQDGKFFGDRLYLLVPSVPQIYKSRLNKLTFNTPIPWLIDDPQMAKNARAIAVDGSLYLLRPNEIIKLFTGRRENWTPYIDPPLEDASRIWTSDAAKNIYVLEASHRRIIVLSKDGSLLAQYVFPDGSNLRDFAIDEKNNLISVLDGTKIEHLDITQNTQ